MFTFSRRDFLAQPSFGLGGLALAWLLHRDRLLAAPPKPELERRVYDLKPRVPARPPQTTAMISLFMQGGPSHIDLFDPKPELTKNHLRESSTDFAQDNQLQASRKLFGSPWKFSPAGACGMELSELLPSLRNVADDVCLIRSMHTGVSGHEPSLWAMCSGRPLRGRPSLGSWFAYGLGTENENLPAFLVLTDPGGLPVNSVDNWSNGWLPSVYQGTTIRPQEPKILNLESPPHLRGAPQGRMLSYVRQLNADYSLRHPRENDLSARMQSYELAARMQVAAREALDISQESAATHRLYGIDDPVTQEYGTRCLIARRLVERGVRFVQVYTGDQAWDQHGGIQKALPEICRRTDKPSAALVLDLKQRGLLDETLVHWGGEMGRLPVIQNERDIGRDHNGQGFTMWLAGGGVRGGLVHGATDEIGYRAVEDIVNHYDYHATLLHLFGLDLSQVTYTRPNGAGTLLDSQPGQVVAKILRRAPQIES